MKLEQLNPLTVVASVLASMWLVLAMKTKRWHDIGRSGWFSFLTFVPYIGLAATIILGLILGNSEEKSTDQSRWERYSVCIEFYYLKCKQ